MRGVPVRQADGIRPANRIMSPPDQWFTTYAAQQLTDSPSGNVGWPSNDLALLIPFRISKPIVAKQLGVATGTTPGSASFDVGIYDAAFNRLVALGTTTLTAVSVWQWTDITDTALAAGKYYLAVTISTTSTQRLIHYGLSATQVYGIVGCLEKASSNPLPSTISTPAEATSFSRLPYVAIAGRDPFV